MRSACLLVGPENNTTMEPEMSALCPELAPFIACSQLPTLNVVPELPARLGIPVWSSITVTACAASRMMAREDV